MTFYNKMVPDGTYCITGYRGDDEHIEFPSSYTISILNDDLFKGHTEITSVNIPDTVTQIGGFIFDGCTNLKAVTLPPKLVDMWQYAFTRTSIEEINIPGGVKTIISFALNDSRKLKKVTLHEGTKKISAWAFKDCVSLTHVYLPQSLTEISENAFEGCGEITFHRI